MELGNIILSNSIQIEHFTVNPFAENTYVLMKDEKAVVFDPGFFHQSEYEKFYELLREHNAELIAIILTHAHIDHVLGVQTLRNRYKVPVYLGDEDRYFWDNFVTQAQMFGFDAQPFNFEPQMLGPQEDWEIGPFTFDVRHTPGHAPCHLVFYMKEEKILIGGDTIFLDSIGRTDLYRGDFKLLEESIREKIYTLPDETKVYPGHGPETTIGYEKKHNPYVRA